MRPAEGAPCRRPAAWRRREVSARLAMAGLAGGAHASAPSAAGEGFGERLRAACADLGPAFGLYAGYLSSRPDLVAPADALALAAAGSGGAEASPPTVVAGFLAAELGAPPERLFASFDPLPFAADPSFQWHRAVVAEAGPVVVKLVRPDLDDRLGDDLAHFDLVRAEAPDLGGVAGEMRADLARRLDLAAEARGLEELALERWERQPLAVPRPLPELSSRRVLCSVWPPAVPPLAGGGQRARSGDARRLCFAWLRQALLGRAVPVEPSAANVRIADDGAIAFVGGPIAAVPAADQRAFGELLLAVAAEAPEEAAGVLARAAVARPKAAGEAGLRLALRQLVPFRDGAATATGTTLHELVLADVRAARELGYRPQGPFLDLVRGLDAVGALARHLDPEGDPLREALHDVRLEMAFAPPASLAEMAGGMASQAALLAEMPVKVDALMTLLARGEAQLDLHLVEATERRRRGDAWVPVVALAAALFAFAATVPRLLALGGGGAWGEWAIVTVVALLGVALLRAAGRDG